MARPGHTDKINSKCRCSTGQYHDAETGLYYNNQRYYDPDTAAYLNPDPTGLNAAPHPQRYVSNPLTAIDPLGLTPQGPSPRMKTDDELQADATALHDLFLNEDGTQGRAYNGTTISTYQADDGKLFYTANKNKTTPELRDLAKQLGYERVFGKDYVDVDQTDAEQIMLNAVDKGAVLEPGRIATSQVPCGEFRKNGKPAQNCGKRISSYPKIRLVGRWA